jgi:uncharacterized protein YggU (UPF0235/DUF167 family)
MERIKIKVVPNSNRDSIEKGDPLIVRVKEPAIKGKANKAVIKLSSKHFGSKVKI